MHNTHTHTRFKVHYVLRSVQSLDLFQHIFIPEDFDISKREMFYWQKAVLHFNIAVVTKTNLFH